MLTRVIIRKQDGQTGVVRPGDEGILAIIAAAVGGPLNEAAPHTDPDLAKAEFVDGVLPELAALVMPVTQKPVVLVRTDASVDGAYSDITPTGAGSSVATAGGTAPYDDFDVQIAFQAGATVGIAGATYRYSLDGGANFSKLLNLGTANNIVIPNTGITIDLGAGSVLAGELLAFTTTRPRASNADLPASLEALRQTRSKFEAVLIDCFADNDTVALVGPWLLTLNGVGRFPTVFMTVRPMGPTESEADYEAAMATLLASAACIDVILCADETDMVSVFRGIAQHRAFGLPVSARSMSVPIGVEPAEVDLGPLQGCSITTTRGNPKHHNEEKFPGLDDLRLTCARTIEGFDGVYIDNTNLFSPDGSDFVYLPHARTVNAACEVAWQLLTKQLSKGVPKNPKAGPNGERYIADSAAQLIEQLVQSAVDPIKKGNLDDLKFRLSRTDNIASNGPAKIRCFMESVALAYVKEFDVTVGFVKQITETAPGT